MRMPDTNGYSGTHLTIGDVARTFGVTPATVREWDRSGKLPAAFRTPGNQRRWNRADVEALLERAS